MSILAGMKMETILYIKLLSASCAALGVQWAALVVVGRSYIFISIRWSLLQFACFRTVGSCSVNPQCYSPKKNLLGLREHPVSIATIFSSFVVSRPYVRLSRRQREKSQKAAPKIFTKTRRKAEAQLRMHPCRLHARRRRTALRSKCGHVHCTHASFLHSAKLAILAAYHFFDIFIYLFIIRFIHTLNHSQ